MSNLIDVKTWKETKPQIFFHFGLVYSIAEL